MKCAWFLIETLLLIICFTDATKETFDDVTFGSGKYDVKNYCWDTEPTKPKLEVLSNCQSLTIRRKILRELKCRPGIKTFLDQKSFDCEPSKVSGIGLTNICPHNLKQVTAIVRNNGTCHVVHPNRQCITYADCEKNKGCSKNDTVTSACLPDRHRFFNVWTHADVWTHA